MFLGSGRISSVFIWRFGHIDLRYAVAIVSENSPIGMGRMRQ